jgi:membrane-associated phospholipid phosphatase
MDKNIRHSSSEIRTMKTHRLKFIVVSFLFFCIAIDARPQSSASDSPFHPYHINYWATGAICGVGSIANYLGISHLRKKNDLSFSEIQALNSANINRIDSWAFKQDPSKRSTFKKFSDFALITSIALPAFLLFDKQIRLNGFDMLLMYLETMSVTTNIYEWSFLGPNFQNKIRPVAYYDGIPYDERKSANNRNSFYSGHVASAAASTFFMAKVYCDSHPGIGNDKYLLYGAALIPPLILGYFRMKALKHFPSDVIIGLGVGAVCGILIPDFHRMKNNKIR